jgi:hypothetical protein
VARLILHSLLREFGAAWNFQPIGLSITTNLSHKLAKQQPNCLGDNSPPNIDLHDLIERDAVLTPVVELGGAVEACLPYGAVREPAAVLVRCRFTLRQTIFNACPLPIWRAA